MIYFVLIALAALSGIFICVHFFGRRHSNVALIIGGLLLTAFFVAVPLGLREYGQNVGESEYQTILEALDFYGTAAGLLSSLFLGYIAFRISRNEHKKNNSSCVSISPVRCKPIFLRDTVNTKEEMPLRGTHGLFKKHKKIEAYIDRAIEDAKLAEAKKKNNGTASNDEIPADKPVPLTADGFTQAQVRDFNHQKFENIPDLGKMTNGRDIRINRFLEKKRDRLKAKLDEMKKNENYYLNREYWRIKRKYVNYIDYASMSEFESNKVLSMELRNQGPAALQRIMLYFSDSNCVYTTFVSFDDNTPRYKFIGIPDDSRDGEVVYVTFISCYNERTYGEFKLTEIVEKVDAKSDNEKKDEEKENLAPKQYDELKAKLENPESPKNEKEADELERAKKILDIYEKTKHYTVKHFHYYGTDDHR